MRNQGVIVVSYGLLRESLGLPDDARIIAIGSQNFNDQAAGVFRILVQHPNLLGVDEGARPPVVRPVTSIDGTGNTFFQWGAV